MGLDISRIRGLCFDVDGTLSDTDDRMVERFARGLAPFRRFLPHRDAQRLARRLVMRMDGPGNLLMGIPDTVGLDDELNRASLFFRRIISRPKPSQFSLIGQVREMLEELYPRYPMSVVSARDKEGTLAFLEQFGLLGYFKVVVTAHTVEHTKPYPDPIRYAAEQMGLSAEQCVMIGDTTVDMRAGKAAKAQTVGVLCGFGDEAELLRSGADLILPTTALLAQILLPQSGEAETSASTVNLSS